jgi:hypothetical protein
VETEGKNAGGGRQRKRGSRWNHRGRMSMEGDRGGGGRGGTIGEEGWWRVTEEEGATVEVEP